MSSDRTPEDTYRELVRSLGSGDVDATIALFSPDVRIEQPFNRPEPVVIEGTDALRAYFGQLGGLPIRMVARDLEIHRTDDPEVVVAEWLYDVTTTTTDPALSVRNITVTRVRDGRIVESRDFHDHAALYALLG